MEQEKQTVRKRIQAKEIHLDSIRGCMVGGAVGDALGYPIEFQDETRIFSKYGKNGITEYALNAQTGKALISDDTQMALFTANGLLVGNTRGCMRGIQGYPRAYVAMAYQDWLLTQEMTYAEGKELPRGYGNGCTSWLMDVPELYKQRAPGITCLSVLERQRQEKNYVDDYIQHPQSNSKGCGSIMRIAPLALAYPNVEPEKLAMEAAQISAITHGHSLGYMPSAVLTYILHQIVFEKKKSLKKIILDATHFVVNLFRDDAHCMELKHIIDLAVSLSENHESDLDNIHRIGGGWVAEETLGIALYCALRYQKDFSAGVITAVNHKGDSDSTGAVTGNILGALLGYHAIEDKWKQHLELLDEILEMSDDLCHDCQMSEYSEYHDDDWARKYMAIKWKDDTCQNKPTQLLAVRGDITKDHGVQAIVNAANTSLLGGGGVDGAIHRAAGPELLEECRLLHGCKTGEAKLTKAYNLPCEYVIHTPGPHWNGGISKERELLASCYRSCLELAVKHQIHSIAFPSISTGIYHFPLLEAAEIAVQTVNDFIKQHPGQLDVVKWVLFDDTTLKAYSDSLNTICP